MNVLILDPTASDSRQIATAVRRETPQAAIARVMHSDQALRLMFERGLLTAKPQIPSLIVLDVAALADGRALLRRLRSDARTSDVPIIVVSAASDAAEIDACRALGASAYVVKSGDAVALDRDLRQVVSEALNRRPERARRTTCEPIAIYG